MSLVLQKNLLMRLFLAKLCEVEVVKTRPLATFTHFQRLEQELLRHKNRNKRKHIKKAIRKL